MRSAASRGHPEKDMDDFTRDMGGRMVIKVCAQRGAFSRDFSVVCSDHQETAAVALCMWLVCLHAQHSCS
jgi:predicted dithiol-disulfide oxidoreductase (DUF899 family)